MSWQWYQLLLLKASLVLTKIQVIIYIQLNLWAIKNKEIKNDSGSWGFMKIDNIFFSLSDYFLSISIVTAMSQQYISFTWYLAWAVSSDMENPLG